MISFIIAMSLSLKTVSDYTYTIPVNTNSIKGIGLITNNGNYIVGGEDPDFLIEAFRERMLLGGGGNIWWELSPRDASSSRILGDASSDYFGFSKMGTPENAFWLTLKDNGMPYDPLRHTCFVSPTFSMYNHEKGSESRTGYIFFGKDAMTDKTAFFTSSSRGVDLEKYIAFTNCKFGSESPLSYTNTLAIYNTLSTDTCSTIYNEREMIQGSRGYISCTNNKHSTYYSNSKDLSTKNKYTLRDQYGASHDFYYYTEPLRDVISPSTNSSDVVSSSQYYSMSSECSVSYSNDISLEYSSCTQTVTFAYTYPPCKVHASEAYLNEESHEDLLPIEDGNIVVPFCLYNRCGDKINNYSNATVRGYIETLWKFTRKDTVTRRGGDFLPVSSETSSTNTYYFGMCFPFTASYVGVGFAEGESNSLWKLDFRPFDNREYAISCVPKFCDNIDFIAKINKSEVPVFSKAQLERTLSYHPQGSYPYVRFTRKHDLICEKIRFHTIVKPVYNARVLSY